MTGPDDAEVLTALAGAPYADRARLRAAVAAALDDARPPAAARRTADGR